MKIWFTIIALLTPLPPAPVDKDAAAAFKEFQAQVCGLLEKLDPGPGKPALTQQQLGFEFSKLLEKYGPKLRSLAGVRKYISADKNIVLIIAANGINGDGEAAKASDPQAKIVIAVAGDGSAANAALAPGFGGSAQAKAQNGVAVAIGGCGGTGFGGATSGGGGGGGGLAEGKFGSICFGGAGGKGRNGGDGGAGGGDAVVSPKAVAAIAKALKKK